MSTSFWSGMVSGVIVGQLLALVVLALVASGRRHASPSISAGAGLNRTHQRVVTDAFEQALRTRSMVRPRSWDRGDLEAVIGEVVEAVLTAPLPGRGAASSWETPPARSD